MRADVTGALGAHFAFFNSVGVLAYLPTLWAVAPIVAVIAWTRL